MFYNPFQMMANGNSLTQGGLRMGMQPSMMNGLFGYSPYQFMGGYGGSMGGSMGGYGMGSQQANPMQMWMSQQYQPGGGNPMGSYTPEQYLPLAGQLGGAFKRVTGYAPDSKAASWIADMYKGGLSAEQIRTAIENQHWGRNTPIGAPTNGQSPNDIAAAQQAAQQAAAEQARAYSPWKNAPQSAGRAWGERVGDYVWGMPANNPKLAEWDGSTTYDETQFGVGSGAYNRYVAGGFASPGEGFNKSDFVGTGRVQRGDDLSEGAWMYINPNQAFRY